MLQVSRRTRERKKYEKQWAKRLSAFSRTCGLDGPCCSTLPGMVATCVTEQRMRSRRECGLDSISTDHPLKCVTL